MYAPGTNEERVGEDVNSVICSKGCNTQTFNALALFYNNLIIYDYMHIIAYILLYSQDLPTPGH